jgi:hypothetical protein
VAAAEREPQRAVLSIKPDPLAWREALKLAGGNPKSIRLVAEHGTVSCVVVNELGGRTAAA